MIAAIMVNSQSKWYQVKATSWSKREVRDSFSLLEGKTRQWYHVRPHIAPQGSHFSNAWKPFMDSTSSMVKPPSNFWIESSADGSPCTWSECWGRVQSPTLQLFIHPTHRQAPTNEHSPSTIHEPSIS